MIFENDNCSIVLPAIRAFISSVPSDFTEEKRAASEVPSSNKIVRPQKEGKTSESLEVPGTSSDSLE